MSSQQRWNRSVTETRAMVSLYVVMGLLFACSTVTLGQGRANPTHVDWSLPWDAEQLGLTDSVPNERTPFSTAPQAAAPRSQGEDRSASRWTSAPLSGYTQGGYTQRESRFDNRSERGQSDLSSRLPSGVIHGLRVPSRANLEGQYDRADQEAVRRDFRERTRSNDFEPRMAQVPTRTQRRYENGATPRTGRALETTPEHELERQKSFDEQWDEEWGLETGTRNRADGSDGGIHAQSDADLRRSAGRVPARRGLFDTQTTSLGPPPGSTDRIQPNLSNGAGSNGAGSSGRRAPVGSETGTDTSSTPSQQEGSRGGGRRTQAEPGGSDPKNGTNSADISRQSWFPLLLTMGLFASIAGNFFFGWVAWDTHARYQDLVDDMSESESRLDRQTRRLRDAEDLPARRIRMRDRGQDVEVARE